MVFVVERGCSDEHFIDENANSIPIDGLAVSMRHDNFGGKIIRCSAEGPSLFRNNLGKSKISQSDMSILGKKNIFRLQVSVNNVPFMKIFDGQNDFGSIKLSYKWGERLQNTYKHQEIDRKLTTRFTRTLRRSEKSSPPQTNSKMIYK